MVCVKLLKMENNLELWDQRKPLESWLFFTIVPGQLLLKVNTIHIHLNFLSIFLATMIIYWQSFYHTVFFILIVNLDFSYNCWKIVEHRSSRISDYHDEHWN